MSLRRKFEAAMGEEAVAAFDWSKILYPPDYVSFVKDKEAFTVSPNDGREVYWILRTCLSRKTPVTPAASRTNVRGQAIPLHGGVVMDLCRMRGVKEVDADAATATVLPGTTYADFAGGLMKRSLRPRVLPFRSSNSSVAGFIAEGGVGLGSLKYGTVANDILHLNFVNPYIKLNKLYYSLGVYPESTPFYRTELDPFISSGGGKVSTYGLGYNLKDLLVGSEGTLGVITQVTLALKPTRGQQLTALFEYSTVEDAAAGLRHAASHSSKPYVLCLLNAEASKHFGVSGSVESFSVLGVLEEEDAEKRATVQKTHEAILAAKGKKQPDEAAAKAWKSLLSGIAYTADSGKFVPSEEIKLPTSKISEALKAVAAAGKKHGFTPAAAVLPYAVDRGLLCTWTPTTSGSSGEINGFASFAAEVRASLRAIDGYPYGVGLMTDEASGDIPPALMSTMKSIKAQLDRRGILNPGKLLDVSKGG
ncbi:MAG: FAD-binding oxidoreductase [Candidatus Bathyarchaeia archaeon]